jgi:probable phosphoglycerate mutase
MMLTRTFSDASGSTGSHGTIYLLRHGAVRSVEGGKRYIGWQDIALSDAGLRQAGAWADYFSGIALDDIYCSDLSRCLETARIIGNRCSLEPKPFPELREVSLGSWEGQCFDTIRSLHPRAFRERGDRIADHRPPAGESFNDLQARAWPIFEAIANRSSGHRLVVTHAGVIRVLVCRLLGMPLENLFRIRQTYGALNIVEVRPANRRILALNLHPDVA